MDRAWTDRALSTSWYKVPIGSNYNHIRGVFKYCLLDYAEDMAANFFAESLNNFKTIGAVAPCSPAGAEKMVEPIDFTKARTIVEFGGGTGPVTKEILKRAHPDARVFVFEINDAFIEELKKIGDSRLTVLHASAENAAIQLQKLEVEKVDCVISTLPLAVLKDDVVDNVFRAIKEILKPGGLYTQIQYGPFLKNRIEKEFGEVKTLFVALNMPPAFVYVCKIA